MATPTLEKPRERKVRRSLTQRAGSKVRRLIERARRHRRDSATSRSTLDKEDEEEIGSDESIFSRSFSDSEDDAMSDSNNHAHDSPRLRKHSTAKDSKYSAESQRRVPLSEHHHDSSSHSKERAIMRSDSDSTNDQKSGGAPATPSPSSSAGVLQYKQQVAPSSPPITPSTPTFKITQPKEEDDKRAHGAVITPPASKMKTDVPKQEKQHQEATEEKESERNNAVASAEQQEPKSHVAEEPSAAAAAAVTPPETESTVQVDKTPNTTEQKLERTLSQPFEEPVEAPMQTKTAPEKPKEEPKSREATAADNTQAHSEIASPAPAAAAQTGQTGNEQPKAQNALPAKAEQKEQMPQRTLHKTQQPEETPQQITTTAPSLSVTSQEEKTTPVAAPATGAATATVPETTPSPSPAAAEAKKENPAEDEGVVTEERDEDLQPYAIHDQTTIEPTKKDDDSITSTSTSTSTNENAVARRVHYFDKQRRGKFTMLDTFTSLRGLGYNWLFAVPATLIMHMRLSPSTSPHKFPLLQWSLKDWLSLPVYTNRLAVVLSVPTMHPVDRWVQLYGQERGAVRGLSFWGGFRALHASEKATLRWWQLGLWLAHRFQWLLTYTMLHDPTTRMVTQPILEGLCHDRILSSDVSS